MIVPCSQPLKRRVGAILNNIGRGGAAVLGSLRGNEGAAQKRLARTLLGFTEPGARCEPVVVFTVVEEL